VRITIPLCAAELTLAAATACGANGEQAPIPGGSATVSVRATIDFSGAATLQGSAELSGQPGSVCTAPNVLGSIGGHAVHITLITETAPLATPVPLTGYTITIKVDGGSWSTTPSGGAVGGSLNLSDTGGVLEFRNLSSDTGAQASLTGSVRWTCV
jgi:hypothetical protein